MDFPILKYFEKIGATIKLSARYEFYDFLGVNSADIATGGKFGKPASEDYDGSILPEASSGFPPGYKVVSFYADADALLRRAFVLRRDGWRGSYQAYQRMVVAPKIEAIRKNLKSKGQVFINNIIATLPSDVHPQDEEGKTIAIANLTKTAPVKVKLPLRANSIGLIDGQHRLYSYYEERNDDVEIAKLRHQQNQLVTGIIYPSKVPPAQRERFEAELFLAINSNQTNAPPALRQEIEVLLSPFSSTAIGRQVMHGLSRTGPLVGHVENYFFDKGKLKTTSIVSYGLGPLIKLGGEDSIFRIFDHQDKDLIASDKSSAVLDDYVRFCVSVINQFLNAVKANLPAERWTTDPRTPGRVLTVTYVNAFLITMRLLIDAHISLEFADLKTKLAGIDDFNFKSFHSSQYGRMAVQIREDYFSSLVASSKL